jgi:hypothetical protein
MLILIDSGGDPLSSKLDVQGFEIEVLKTCQF